MTHYICVTCGAQFAASNTPPEHCPICEDERQYVGVKGQQWTTLNDLRRTHHNEIQSVEPNVYYIKTEPPFAIGQRAFFIQSPRGNILWDCISLLDDATITRINELGGIAAIAISHPHYYSTIVEWSHSFGYVPVYIHASDRAHVMRPDAVIRFWEDETQPLGDNLTLIRCGGHFDGAAVLHWASGANGHGALFSGDTLQVVSDRRYVSFMYSYPNLIPLRASAIRTIVKAIEPFNYDRIYGAFGGVVTHAAQAAVHRSANRYLKAITEP